MPHEVLQCLWIHSRFCHIRAIGMSAYMRRDVWHLHPIDIIVSPNHMIESVLPVHCHKWHSIVIVEKESTVAINGFFHFRSIPVFDDCSKHFCHIFCYRQHSCSCMSANMRGNIGHSYWRLPDMAPDRHSLPGFYNLLP